MGKTRRDSTGKQQYFVHIFIILFACPGLVAPFSPGEMPRMPLHSYYNAAPIPEHDTMTEYTGPETCIQCHQEEAVDMFGTVHYQWTGPTPNATNITGDAGKGDGGFNTYCGTPVSSRHISCYGCHVGNGGAPSSEMSQAQLNNIDCMMCHQELYERKPAPPFETVTYTGHDSVTRSWNLPVEDASGSFQFTPNLDAMSIGIVEAARTVHLPNRATCLRCHAYAAGSDCGKRGDLGTGSVAPPLNVDVHMSPLGQDFQCQDCHRSKNHHVMGRGLDLRPNDRNKDLTCTLSGCHSETPHETWRLDQHAGRVACQSCHIPTYAKQGTTEMARDWNFPYWAQGLFSGQGGFKPEETGASDLIPTYAWYDGTSRVYALGQVPELNAGGAYELGAPNGAVNTPGSKIHPMKEHVSNSARHTATGQLIPHATFTYFVTGDFSQAVADGQQYSGLTGAWDLVDVHTFQTINHGVEPHDNALNCSACHEPLSGGQPVRMDLQGNMGYEVKGALGQVCTQCHTYENPEGFNNDHNKHVRDKNFDCLWCHNFARPERNLTSLLTCNLDPNTTTIPRGGKLRFRATAINNTSDNQDVFFASRVTLPSGITFPASGYLFGPVPVRLNPDQSKSGPLSHAIPQVAPLGTYTYHAYLFDETVGIIDENTFQFTVTPAAGGPAPVTQAAQLKSAEF